MTHLSFTINGEVFTISEYDTGFAWTHHSKSKLMGVIAEGDCVSTPLEAQQDAIRYVRDLEAEEEEREQEERDDARFGTYNEQVRAMHRALTR